MDRASSEDLQQMMTISRRALNEGAQNIQPVSKSRTEKKSAESVFRPLTRPTAQNS